MKSSDFFWSMVRMQVEHYLQTQRLVKAGFPEWYEVKRKTTHTVFWR